MINYLSLWIANFGVEPLLAIMFFLALPAFFFLNLLLHLVCIVFEAMILPLPFYIKQFHKFRSLFLSIVSLSVKTFLVALIAMTQPVKAKPSKISEIFISPGEQVEIKASKLKRFSIGNKDTIKHKHRPSKGVLLIKGKKIGFSDIYIWGKNWKRTYHIYVISKKKQLEKISLIESLKKLNLNIRTQGEFVFTSGEIKTIEQYLIINKILNAKYKNLISNISIGNELKKEIIAKIYLDLYSLGASKVICANYGLRFNCSVDGIDFDSTLVKHLQTKFDISFDSKFNNYSNKNYMAFFKIIQIETSSREIDKLGLDKISTQIKNLLNLNEVINEKEVEINNSHTKIKVLAEPKTTLIINQKSNIQLGAEIPFNLINQTSSSVSWKFYGLKIASLLRSLKGKLVIDFSTELTAPNDNIISGSKGKSSYFIHNQNYNKLFEVGYTVDSENISALPIIGELPFIKSLFTNEIFGKSYKHIICFLKIKEL